MQIPNWLVRIVGKKVVDNGIEKSGISKTKIIAVVGAAIGVYNVLCASFALPPIPKEVLEMLAALGLFTLRDSIK